MGCASSKQKRCRHCNAPYSPVPRSYSVHVHHPPQSKDDSYHVVGLTSTTLGSLKLDLSHKALEKDGQNGGLKFTIGNLLEKEKKNEEALDGEIKTKGFPKGLIEAKTWSNMIDHKIPKVVPKTPTATPSGETETINTWELMEGLEDASPFPSPNHFRSFSFDVHSHPIPAPSNQSKPVWLRLQMTENDSTLKSTISDDEPQVVSSSSKSLQQLSPDSPLRLRTVYNEKQQGMPRKGFSFDATGDNMFNYGDIDFKPFPWRQDKVILYFTSLRGIRKTYEDCCHVRMILKGLGVRVDERDVSLHSGFKEELIELLGDGFNWGGLPRVFVGKNYIGGVEEIQKLHEDGQLQKLIEPCEKVDDGGEVCEDCGDLRFVPCETCFGSCKLYCEEEEDDGQVGEYGFQRCPDCNENGLIRCPICC